MPSAVSAETAPMSAESTPVTGKPAAVAGKPAGTRGKSSRMRAETSRPGASISKRAPAKTAPARERSITGPPSSTPGTRVVGKPGATAESEAPVPMKVVEIMERAMKVKVEEKG